MEWYLAEIKAIIALYRNGHLHGRFLEERFRIAGENYRVMMANA